MSKQQDKETRYFIDIDLASFTIIHMGYNQRCNLVKMQVDPLRHRLFVTRGQYNKLLSKKQYG